MEAPSLGAGFSYSIQGAWSYLLQIGLDLRLFIAAVRLQLQGQTKPIWITAAASRYYTTSILRME